MTSSVPESSYHLVDEIADAPGRRRLDTPVAKGYVRADDKESPFHAVYVGGRSGLVAVKLHLALLWRLSAPPYEARRIPARSWALLLGLDDPERSGARRVRAAISRLGEASLLTVSEDPGFAPTLRLLSELGDGEPYVPAPTAQFRDPSKLYFKVSVEMWREGHIQSLHGPGLAMYLILAAEQAYQNPVWFSTHSFSERYGISPQTRAKGTRELQDLRLLQVRSKALDPRGDKVSFNQLHRRYVYRLRGDAKPS